MSAALAEVFREKRDPGAEFVRCQPWLEAALTEAHGTHTIADIRAGVASGIYHFWPGANCAAITEVFQFPRKRLLNVFLAGGSLEEILVMERDFCRWAAHLGCEGLTMTGRPGWKKKLQQLGWQPSAVVLLKPLEAGSTT